VDEAHSHALPLHLHQTRTSLAADSIGISPEGLLVWLIHLMKTQTYFVDNEDYPCGQSKLVARLGRNPAWQPAERPTVVARGGR
jgi:hypothetical protein